MFLAKKLERVKENKWWYSTEQITFYEVIRIFSFTADMVVYIYFYRTELQTDHGEASLENDAFTISIPYIIYFFQTPL